MGHAVDARRCTRTAICSNSTITKWLSWAFRTVNTPIAFVKPTCFIECLSCLVAPLCLAFLCLRVCVAPLSNGVQLCSHTSAYLKRFVLHDFRSCFDSCQVSTKAHVESYSRRPPWSYSFTFQHVGNSIMHLFTFVCSLHTLSYSGCVGATVLLYTVGSSLILLLLRQRIPYWLC